MSRNRNDWNTSDVQCLIDSLAGYPQIFPSVSRNSNNDELVSAIRTQLLLLISDNRAALAPIFDPVYVYCDFSGGGTNPGSAPPQGWAEFITRLQVPQGGWPVWHTSAPPVTINHSDGIFGFAQGILFREIIELKLTLCYVSCTGNLQQQLEDAHSLQGLIRGRFEGLVAISIICTDLLISNF